jgi:hypothetical protein
MKILFAALIILIAIIGYFIYDIQSDELENTVPSVEKTTSVQEKEVTQEPVKNTIASEQKVTKKEAQPIPKPVHNTPQKQRENIQEEKSDSHEKNVTVDVETFEEEVAQKFFDESNYTGIEYGIEDYEGAPLPSASESTTEPDTTNLGEWAEEEKASDKSAE